MTLGPDIQLDPLTHDLTSTDGALTLVADVLQAIKIRLLLVKEEWYLDTDAGVPYFEDIFVKAPDLDRIRSIYRQVIIETPGVLDVLRIDLTYTAGSRELLIDFKASTDAGEIDTVVGVPV